MTFSFESFVRDGPLLYDTTMASYEEALGTTNSRGAESSLSGCRTMSRADLERQLEALHPASFAWAIGCCGRDRSEAEEVLQETYLKILDGRARFEGRSALKTWLFAVIRRTAAAHRRLRWLRDFRFVSAELDTISSSDESTEQQMLHSERTRTLLRAIGRLARRQLEVIELVFYHQMTVAEAADVAGVSIGTARVHYQRGKQRLLAELKREEMR
jgi:RNA polymerase sigma factor (sigma-70 family)